MRRNGFTLIELLVVIVIILILLSIGAGVGSWMSRTGEEQLTQTTLRNLQMIYEELENVGARPTSTSQLVTFAKQREAIKGLLGNIPANMFNTNGTTVNDAWGKEIWLSVYTPASTPPYTSPSGSVLAHRGGASYFASAGPDGQWGNATSAVGTTARTQSGDNLYSYAMTR